MHVVMRSRPESALTVEAFEPDGDGPFVVVAGLDHTEHLTLAAARELAAALLAVADQLDSRR